MKRLFNDLNRRINFLLIGTKFVSKGLIKSKWQINNDISSGYSTSNTLSNASNVNAHIEIMYSERVEKKLFSNDAQ